VLPDPIARGAALFDAGEYFEAHEAWEEHWGKGGADERALTLGLIKAAVALHHLHAGNAAGFQWQAERAVPPLRDHAGVWPELETARLAEALDALASQARFHGAPLPDASVPPLLGEATRDDLTRRLK
jgi:hypothetical protein